MEILFESIAKRLALVTELRWIDWEQGQLEVMEESLPVQFPCALIDIADIPWEHVGENVQLGKVSVNVRIAFDVYEDLYTVDGEPNPTFDIAIERMGIIRKVYKSLQGFRGLSLAIPDTNPVEYRDNHFARLNRVRQFTEKRIDQLKIIVLVFETSMRDSSAYPELIDQDITLQVSPE